MVESFILLEIKTGKIRPAIDLLKKIPEIKSISSNNTGSNIAIFIKINKLKNLHSFLSKRIGKISWIKKIEIGIVIKKIIK